MGKQLLIFFKFKIFLNEYQKGKVIMLVIFNQIKFLEIQNYKFVAF